MCVCVCVCIHIYIIIIIIMADYKNIHNKFIYQTPKLETIQNTIRDWIIMTYSYTQQ